MGEGSGRKENLDRSGMEVLCAYTRNRGGADPPGKKHKANQVKNKFEVGDYVEWLSKKYSSRKTSPDTERTCDKNSYIHSRCKVAQYAPAKLYSI